VGVGQRRSQSMSTIRARQLRRDPTTPERRLWAILHSFRERGYHFRRQYPIGSYYADFACIHGKLIIEADGETHAHQVEYDRERDAFLRSRGFRVLRLWNNEIMDNAEGVYEVIAQALAHVPSLTPTPDPSPSEGGGRPRLRRQRTGLKDLSDRTS
jgi:very-short-patch-repair endonuclease